MSFYSGDLVRAQNFTIVVTLSGTLGSELDRGVLRTVRSI